MMLNNDKRAPVAQLDRASGYGPEGLGFESLRVYHFKFYKNFNSSIDFSLIFHYNFLKNFA